MMITDVGRWIIRRVMRILWRDKENTYDRDIIFSHNVVSKEVIRTDPMYWTTAPAWNGTSYMNPYSVAANFSCEGQPWVVNYRPRTFKIIYNTYSGDLFSGVYIVHEGRTYPFIDTPILESYAIDPTGVISGKSYPLTFIDGMDMLSININFTSNIVSYNISALIFE